MDEVKQIDSSLFEFVQSDKVISDKKIESKKIGYFKDAFIRFSKNKASVVAFFIICFLFLFAIFSPILGNTTYTGPNYDANRLYYQKLLPKASIFEGTGFWDGSYNMEVNKHQLNKFYAMGVETNTKPVVKVKAHEVVDGKDKYSIRVDSYKSLGMKYLTVSVEEYENLQKWQDENNIQLIYPAVNFKTNTPVPSLPPAIKQDANIWYVIDSRGNPFVKGYDENKEPIFQQSYNTTADDHNYDSLRIEGDNGSYKYAIPSGSSGYLVRINLYSYFQYLYGYEPTFLFGTDGSGYDIFTRLGKAARFSFLLAIFVSILNLIIGAIYGAIEGYYGGRIDLAMERISDILGNIPFMVVTTLFQLHLASKVGPVVSLLFAFVLTGWIGTAHTVRMQFYRYKNQEYVLAARTLGASNKRLMFKHIFPNALGTLITSSVLVIPSVIFSESSLTYLGIVNLDSAAQSSVGTMLANAQQFLQTQPHIILFPALFISLLMITFNLFGNGLRDAFNPSLRGAED